MRVLLCVALCLVSWSAWADPLVLRAPVASRVAAVIVGAPEVSVGLSIDSRYAIALEWRLPRSAVGASIGRRWTLVGEELGWGVDAHLAAGVVFPLLSPAVALSATPAVVGRWRNQTFAVAVSGAAPLVVKLFPEADLRVPLLFEAWFVARVRDVYFGVQGSVGGTYVPGLSWSAAFQGSLYAAWAI
jgi:hypothetical protein